MKLFVDYFNIILYNRAAIAQSLSSGTIGPWVRILAPSQLMNDPPCFVQYCILLYHTIILCHNSYLCYVDNFLGVLR